MSLRSRLNRAGGLVFVSAACLAVSGCALGGASKADEFAMTACGIEYVDETGAATSRREAPVMNPWDFTYQMVQETREMAEAAASAAAEDPSYVDLKKSFSIVYVKRKKAYDSWRSARNTATAEPLRIREFWRLFDDDDVNAHNEAFDVVEVECNALTARLNS